MSGGIFPDYPFTLNIKCIIFSIIIMMIYSYCPPQVSFMTRNIIYFIIFVISYVSLAWYDYYYECSQLPLQRSSVGLTQYFKPPVYDVKRQSEHMFSQKELDKNNVMIYVMHLLLFVPLLLYVGFKGAKSNIIVFNILIVVAAFTAVYHGFRLLSTSHMSTSPNGSSFKTA